MELLDAFKWRYATKKFDPSKKVDQTLVDKIVEAAWMLPPRQDCNLSNYWLSAIRN
jgi:hypothetical protein